MYLCTCVSLFVYMWVHLYLICQGWLSTNLRDPLESTSLAPGLQMSLHGCFFNMGTSLDKCGISVLSRRH